MKVLKNNYHNHETTVTTKVNKPYPRDLICGTCGSELQYEEPDVYVGAYGCAYVDCPCCGNDNMLEDNEHSIDLTADNVEFPSHFHHCSAENGAVDCCNNEKVKEAIHNAINYFRNNKSEFAWITETGNLHVCVFRYDGDEDYYVVVSNDYYDTHIPFEDKDFEVTI